MESYFTLLKSDPDFCDYFKEKDFYKFVKKYIQVDKLLVDYFKINETVNPDNSKETEIFDELNSIKQLLINNNNNIENIHNNVLSSNVTLLSSLERYNSEMLNGSSFKDEFKNILESFKEKIDILSNKKLNDIDRKSLDMLSGVGNTLIQSLDSHTINHKISSIEKVLNSLHENFTGGSSKKGAAAENILLNNLKNAFPDAEVLDVHDQKNTGDIHIIKDNKPKILIDSKHFDTTVPKKDLDKFYADIQLQNCSGILCNAFGGIANRKDFSIDFVDNNVLIFIHNHKFDNNLFTLAVNIIYNIHDHIKDKVSDSVIIDQRLFNNLKIEYSFFLQTYNYHLDIIKTNINSLDKLKFTLLDHFFKRKSTTNELKKFGCHLCSTGCSTDKALKRHYKDQHQILFNKNGSMIKSNIDNGNDASDDSNSPPKSVKKKITKKEEDSEKQVPNENQIEF